MFVSITWEEAILVHLWKQSFITCWSKEQLIGNLFRWCLFPFAPFIKYLLEKKKDIDVCTVCISSLHILLSILLSFFTADILLFLCGEEVVTQQCLLKVWFLTIGFISHMLFLTSFVYVLSKFHLALLVELYNLGNSYKK